MTKSSAPTIEGTVEQCEHPDWRPLLQVVGELTGWFMWMYQLRLVDGRAVHAFKHHTTRRYFHLGEDGEAFEYVPPQTWVTGEQEGSYRLISRVEAIEEAFRNYRHRGDLTRDELEELESQLAHARGFAERGELMAIDPRELELQREYEEKQAREGRAGRGQDSSLDAAA